LEKLASLELRRGRAEVIDAYVEHGRVVDEDAEAMMDAAYAGWMADVEAGRGSMLIAEIRKSLYVAMTRGRYANTVYVATDQGDDARTGSPPGTEPEPTARWVLEGVLRNQGADASAHQSARAEEDQWRSIAQLAAEYETIATAAMRVWCAGIVRRTSFPPERAEAIIEDERFEGGVARARQAEAEGIGPLARGRRHGRRLP
jgi:hypothetical protein